MARSSIQFLNLLRQEFKTEKEWTRFLEMQVLLAHTHASMIRDSVKAPITDEQFTPLGHAMAHGSTAAWVAGLEMIVDGVGRVARAPDEVEP